MYHIRKAQWYDFEKFEWVYSIPFSWGEFSLFGVTEPFPFPANGVKDWKDKRRSFLKSYYRNADYRAGDSSC